MVYISIALAIVGLANVFPYSVDVAGLSTSDLLNSIQEDESTIRSLTESGNIVEYAVASGYIAWEGVKIIVSVLMFVLGGFAEILILLGVDSAIAVLLQAGIDFLVIFEFGQTIFNRG
jgi:hypothetical protein